MAKAKESINRARAKAKTRAKTVATRARDSKIGTSANAHMSGFEGFLREQGVVALGVGFILGVAVKDFVTIFIDGIVGPVLGQLLGNAKGLDQMTLSVGSMVFKLGAVVSSALDLIVIAFVVYFFVKILRFDRLDKAKTK